mmetsp:Transcript_15616/g.39619  ORF Transcript_15616/g.39619 Transcript_15616/m.39619 type:complete len:222 (+) Transcript_15616:1185-1850(+)
MSNAGVTGSKSPPAPLIACSLLQYNISVAMTFSMKRVKKLDEAYDREKKNSACCDNIANRSTTLLEYFTSATTGVNDSVARMRSKKLSKSLPCPRSHARSIRATSDLPFCTSTRGSAPCPSPSLHPPLPADTGERQAEQRGRKALSARSMAGRSDCNEEGKEGRDTSAALGLAGNRSEIRLVAVLGVDGASSMLTCLPPLAFARSALLFSPATPSSSSASA